MPGSDTYSPFYDHYGTETLDDSEDSGVGCQERGSGSHVRMAKDLDIHLCLPST